MAAEKNAPPRTLYRKFKQPFFLTEIYSAEPPSVSIVKELSEKSENRGFAPASSGGAVAGSARLARRRAARSNSERAAAKDCVGNRFGSQVVWNRSNRCAGARPHTEPSSRRHLVTSWTANGSPGDRALA